MEVPPLKSEVIRVAFPLARIDGGPSRVVERRKVYDWDDATDRAWNMAADMALEELRKRKPKPYDWDDAWDRAINKAADTVLAEQQKQDGMEGGDD